MHLTQESLLGIFFLIIGVVLWLSVRLSLKEFSTGGGNKRSPERSGMEDSNDKITEAVVFVKTGGQLKSINQKARELFAIQESQPITLQSIAQRVSPSSAFYTLCSESGEFEVEIEQNRYYCTSFSSSDGYLLIFKPYENVNSSPLPPQDINIINQKAELLVALSTSIDLESLITTFLIKLLSIVPADMIEINVWDDDADFLLPFRIQKGVNENKPYKAEPKNKLGDGISGKLIQTNEMIWIEDLAHSGLSSSIFSDKEVPFASLLGFPLIVEHEVLGTLELYSLQISAFDNTQTEFVSGLVSQLSSLINNSILFKVEKQKASELNSLAQLAQSANYSREPEKIFEHMLATISPMLSLEMIGFLLFNENRQILAAQSPFVGLPTPFVEIFKTEFTSEGKAEKLIAAQDVLITENAESDLQWMTLGLDHIARAASIREAVLIPLLSAGKSLGYLMAANHKNEKAVFNQMEMHSLMIVANQAAPIIDNMILVQQSHQRAQRAEILRKIALFSSSNAGADEILAYTIEQLTMLANGNCGALFLLDSETGSLSLQSITTYGNAKSHINIEPLQIIDSQYIFSATHTQKPIILGRFDEAEPVIPFYQQMIDAWKLRSVLIFPLVIQSEGVGELWIGSELPNQYDGGDIQALNPAIEQLIGVIEQSKNPEQPADHFKLKAEKLASQAKIVREILSQNKIQDALEIIARQALFLSSADAFSIIILDNPNEKINSHPIINLGELIDEELLLDVRKLSPNGKVFSSSDKTGLETKFLINGSKSAIYLPFSVETKYNGVLFLYGQKIRQFTKAQYENVQILFNHAMPAFEKVFAQWQQQEQIQALIKKIAVQNKLYILSQQISSEIPLTSAIEAVAAELLNELSLTDVRIYSFDKEQRFYREVFKSGTELNEESSDKSVEMEWDMVEVLLNPTFRYRNFYFIPPTEKLPANFPDAATMINREFQNLILYPLVSDDGMPSGLVQFIAPAAIEFNDHSLDLVSLFMAHLGNLLENERIHLNDYKFGVTEKNIDLVSRSNAALTMLPDEVSYSNFDINSVLTDENIISVINSADSEMGLTELGEIFLQGEIFQIVIIFIKNQNQKIDIRLNLGSNIQTTRLEASLGQPNPVTQLLDQRKPFIIKTPPEEEIWANSPFLEEFPKGEIIFLPWNFDHQDAIILLFAKETSLGISSDQLGLLARRMNFLSFLMEQHENNVRIDADNIKLQRALSFGLTLDKLDPIQIAESLLSHSRELINAAQCGWVGFWNEITQEIKPATVQGYKNSTALMGIRFSPDIWTIPIIALEKGEPLRINDLNFVKNYPLEAGDLLRYQSASGGRLPISTLLLPLLHEGERLGILILENFDHPSVFEAEDEAVVTLLGQQASSALANAGLYQEKLSEALSLKQEQNLLAFQLKVQATLITGEEFGKTITAVLDVLSEATHADLALLHLAKNDQVFQNGWQNQKLERKINDLSQPSIGKIASKLEEVEQPINLDEIYKNSEWSDKIGPDFPFLSLFSYPFKYGRNEKAALIFASTEPFQFTNTEIKLIGQIIPYLNQFLDHAELLHQLQLQKVSLSSLEIEKNDIYQRSLAILGAMSDGVLIGDAENAITFINQAARKILDLSDKNVQPFSIDSLSSNLGKCMEGWKNTLQIWCKNPPVLNVDKNYSEKIMLGSQRIISIQSSPVLYQMQLLGTVSIFRDITVEAQVDRMKSEFVANVSHELRTPLTSIKGYAELMLMGAAGEFNEQQKRFLNIIASNSTRLNVLVDNLLDISKIENEKIHLDFRAVYLDKTIFQLVREYQALSDEESKSIHFETKIPKNMKPIWADEMRIHQILNILLNNSYHYSHEGGRIILKVSQTKNETQLDVQDFGIGIKNEFQDHIFERFFRGEEELVLATSGTGLGLAVAKSLVEMQGGQIWFYSAGKDGEGSVFSFTIPVYDPVG